MEKSTHFGMVIRRLRLERGFSQERLADLLDMGTNAYISRLESGKKQPSLEMVFRLAKALNMKAWEIVKAIDEKKD